MNNQTLSFNDIFRVTSNIVFIDEDHTPCARLKLGNSAGELSVSIKQEKLEQSLGQLNYLEVVRAKGFLSNGIATMCSLARVNSEEILKQTRPLSTIPRSLCKGDSELECLAEELSAFKTPHLVRFVRRVLEREQVFEAFVKIPASARHHHSEPGGLLRHSRSVANTVLALISLHEPRMSNVMREIGYIAGLFHDIGKIRTLDHQGRVTKFGRLVEHEAFTLEICGPALQWLDKVDSEAAVTLRHIWTAASPGARYGMQPMMPLARFVRDADGMSAISDHEAKLYSQTKSKSGFITAGRTRYWRPNNYLKMGMQAF